MDVDMDMGSGKPMDYTMDNEVNIEMADIDDPRTIMLREHYINVRLAGIFRGSFGERLRNGGVNVSGSGTFYFPLLIV